MGSVLYFAGENPTDIQMRWLGLTQEMRMESATADVHFMLGAMTRRLARLRGPVYNFKGLLPAIHREVNLGRRAGPQPSPAARR